MSTAIASRLARGTCTECDAEVALRNGGLVREHRPRPSADSAARPNGTCRGSGVACVEQQAWLRARSHGAAPTDTAAPKPLPVEMLSIPLERLRPAPDNPRKDVGDVAELAASVGVAGILQPLLATPVGNGTYTIVCGHRRHAAATAAGLTEVPVMVRQLDDAGRAEAMLVENCHRSDLTPLEEAEAYKALMRLGSMSQRRLSERVSRSQGHISKRLGLLDLPPTAQQALVEGVLGVGDCADLAKLDAGRARDVVKQVRSGRRFEHVFSGELEAQQRRRKADAKVAELEAAGVVVLRAKGHWYQGNKGGDLTGKEVEITQYGRLDHVKPAAHLKEPCRVAIVDSSRVVENVCSDPSRHPRPKAAKNTAAKAEEARRKEAKRAAAERAAARVPAQRRAVEALAPSDAGPEAARLLQLLGDWVLDEGPRFDDDMWEHTYRLLTDAERPGASDLLKPGWRDSVVALASDDAARAAVAYLLAVGENGWEPTVYQPAWVSEPALLAYRLLVEHGGYEPTPAEQLRFGQQALEVGT